MFSAHNPYRNRKPVTDPALFYGRNQFILSLANKIQDLQMCAVSGEPLIGKTSLIYYLVHPEGAWLWPAFQECLGETENYLFVLIEIKRRPVKSSGEFFRYVFDRITEEAEQKKLASESFSSESDYKTQRSLESFLKKLKRRVVLFFDDFDVLCKELSPADFEEVLQRLCVLSQSLDLHDILSCLFFSTERLDQLLRSQGFTNVSPFAKGMIDSLFLGPLEEKEVETFVKEPLQSQSVPFPESDFKLITNWAGRHPALLKIACFHWYEVVFNKQNLSDGGLCRKVEEDVTLKWLMESLTARLGPEEKQALMDLSVGREVMDDFALEGLVRKGLVDQSNSSAWILGDIFKNFLHKKNGEERQQILTNVTSQVENFETVCDGYEFRRRPAKLEKKLFSYLFTHSEQTCARTELQTAIWEDKQPTSPDALEQLIKRIREKIEPLPEFPQYLLTVRGQGYLLRKKS